MLSVVAVRYARALVDVITAPGANVDTARVLAELHAIQGLIGESHELKAALESPAVSPSKKRAVMGRLIEPLSVLSAVRNFVFVIIDHRRTHDFPAIVEAFEAQLDERLGFVRADVSSARELNDSQRAALESRVARLAGRKARLRFTIDPTLIAGVVARVGSKVYDGSVRGQLDRFRTRLV